jgi:hypothetical protein
MVDELSDLWEESLFVLPHLTTLSQHSDDGLGTTSVLQNGPKDLFFRSYKGHCRLCFVLSVCSSRVYTVRV